MAAVDGAIKSVIQGVSQQVPRERLDGQVSLQVNMLSDVVRGLRRRPGMQLLASGLFGSTTWTREQVYATSVDIGDSQVHVLVNVVNGELRVYSSAWALLATQTLPYLVASTASQLRTATLRGYLYICNIARQPARVVTNTGVLNPLSRGFFFVKTSAYSKTYGVIVTYNGTAYPFSYTTPSGAASGDAALSTPEYVASQLVQQMITQIPGISWAQTGGYVYGGSASGGTVVISSESGSTYIGTSNAGRVALVADLPARLPASADGYVLGVGNSDKVAVSYKYSYSQNSWVESGAYGSPSTLTDMPIRMKLDTTYAVESPAYEGRLAGNDDSNEDPPFLTSPVTGFAAFQGRLVLLAGPSVSMSASGKPLRWYRSTVTDLLIVDALSIYSGAATSANFAHAIQFNKDLLLFSSTCQAVIPSGNAVITPSTAQIVITSSYATTTKAVPIVAGRSLLYFAPRSEKFASVLEMVPSNTTDSQYTTNDVTAHLPRYMPGVVRQATASTTSNSLVVACDGDARTLFVQDYLWSGDEKKQAAWHAWTVPYDVVCTWFVRDAVFIGIIVEGALAVVSIEPQAAATVNGNTRPRSDLYQAVQVSGGKFTVPTSLRAAYTAGSRLLLTFSTGSTAGEWAGIESVGVDWVGTVVRNIPDGTYMLGLRYRSAFSPTPPLLRDRNNVVIGTGHSQLVRYEVTMQDVGEFNVQVLLRNTELSDLPYSGLSYSSQELLPNTPLYATSPRIIIPVRALAQDTNTTFYTDMDHDLGVLTVEYVMQTHQRRRRA